MHIAPIVYPTILSGLENGRLPDGVLRDCIGGRLLVPAAVAWDRMVYAAAADGIRLAPASEYDTYRPYEVQKRIFLDRYTTTWVPFAETRVWSGQRFWKRPGTASAAVPGTSNHGLGLAVDVADVTVAGRYTWLDQHAAAFGWSWELPAEKWHLRYVAGDDIPGGWPNEGDEDDMTDEQIDRLAQRIADAIFAKQIPLHDYDAGTNVTVPYSTAVSYQNAELSLIRRKP